MSAVSLFKIFQFTMKNAILTAEVTTVLLSNLTTSIQPTCNVSSTVLMGTTKLLEQQKTLVLHGLSAIPLALHAVFPTIQPSV
jgi:hypothetical protein